MYVCMFVCIDYLNIITFFVLLQTISFNPVYLILMPSNSIRATGNSINVGAYFTINIYVLSLEGRCVCSVFVILNSEES